MPSDVVDAKAEQELPTIQKPKSIYIQLNKTTHPKTQKNDDD